MLYSKLEEEAETLLEVYDTEGVFTGDIDGRIY